MKENSERLKEQRNTKIEIIIGNPPYSVWQKSANDNAQNNYYAKLESRISETYAAESINDARRQEIFLTVTAVRPLQLLF